MPNYKTIEWLEDKQAVRLLDQAVLPDTVAYKELADVESVAGAIRDMTVRGAPAIGVTAAYGLVIAALKEPSEDLEVVRRAMKDAAEVLRAARPTAVNLAWALAEVDRRVADAPVESAADLREALLACASEMAREDIEINRAIGRAAMALMPPSQVTFIHHCNTGSLATVEYGTALGVIRAAHENGLKVNVFVDETRPRFQGSRLTCWELQNEGIAHRLIVDGASSHVMQRFPVDMCVVGTDRVAANGDVANKVGTCNLAAAAKAHGVPFYVAAPLSSVDLDTPTGADIEIEQRDPEEITTINGSTLAPRGVEAYNPAFDITPAALVTAIITEKGIAYPPFEESLRRLKRGQSQVPES